MKFRYILPTLIFTLLLLPGAVRADDSPKYELRAAWLTTVYGIDWPSERGTDKAVSHRQQDELRAIISRLHDAGFNAVFFQVRPMADAFYRSSIEPWSAYVSGHRGVAPAYDPLELCVRLCHEKGMECHAWVNPLRVGTKKPDTRRDRQSARLWMTNRVGRTTMTIFNPALQATRDHLCAVCSEIATNYDIDGIVFDDYFYNPEFLPEDQTAADWNLYAASDTTATTFDQWRRDNINAMIADVSHTLAGIKNGIIRFGVSPQGIGGGNGAHSDAGVPPLTDYGIITADSQYSKIYSDPVKWLRDGTIDYISPQIYWTTDNPRHSYTALTQWWSHVAALFGRHCFPSHTIASLASDDSDEARCERLNQVRANRRAMDTGCSGSVFYSATHLAGKKAGTLCDNLRDSLFTSPALIPPMRWRTQASRVTLDGLHQSDETTISWDAAGDCRYVIYAIPPQIDLLEALSAEGGLNQLYIIGVTYSTTFQIPTCYSDYRIAVAPYDRYGFEWEPQFLQTTFKP